MNRHIVWPVALIATALAACGGGGSTPGPVPTPVQTAPPGVTYKAQLVFVGALGGQQVQSDLRRAELATMGSSSTPPPIMVVAPMTAQGNIGSLGYSTLGGQVEAQVSPMPSAIPATTFANTNPDAQLQPSQLPLPTDVVAMQLATSNGTANVQASGIVTANIGAPVNLAPSTQVYTYDGISVECHTPLDPGAAAAWQYNGTSWVAVTDPTQADIYLSGPRCDSAGSTTATTDPTLNFPNGGILLSSDTAFNSLTASQWANTVTSFDLASPLNGDGSINGVIVAKTASGAVFKAFPSTVGTFNYEYSGPIEVSGNSVDGF